MQSSISNDKKVMRCALEVPPVWKLICDYKKAHKGLNKRDEHVLVECMTHVQKLLNKTHIVSNAQRKKIVNAVCKPREAATASHPGVYLKRARKALADCRESFALTSIKCDGKTAHARIGDVMVGIQEVLDELENFEF